MEDCFRRANAGEEIQNRLAGGAGRVLGSVQKERCRRRCAVWEEMSRVSNEGRKVLDERCMRSSAEGLVHKT